MNDALGILKIIRNFDDFEKRAFLLCGDEIVDAKRWRKEIPYISWPNEWEVKIIPAMAALFRGIVRLKADHSRLVSFYLDGYANLGCMYKDRLMKTPEPYWEIYNISEPVEINEDEGPERYLMNEVDKMIEGIRNMLNKETLKDVN